MNSRRVLVPILVVVALVCYGVTLAVGAVLGWIAQIVEGKR